MFSNIYVLKAPFITTSKEQHYGLLAPMANGDQWTWGPLCSADNFTYSHPLEQKKREKELS